MEDLLKEVRALREKVEWVEELVEERLLGVEEPLEDEARAIRGYAEARARGEIGLTRIEDVGKRM